MVLSYRPEADSSTGLTINSFFFIITQELKTADTRIKIRCRGFNKAVLTYLWRNLWKEPINQKLAEEKKDTAFWKEWKVKQAEMSLPDAEPRVVRSYLLAKKL